MSYDVVNKFDSEFDENSAVSLTDGSVKNLMQQACAYTAAKQAIEIAGANTDLYKNGIIYALANSKTSKKTGKSARDCTAASIAMCWLASVQLQLPFDARGLIYLVPYGKEASFTISYKGLVVLAKRGNPDILNIEVFPIGRNIAPNVKIVKSAKTDDYEVPIVIDAQQYGYDDIVGCLSVIHYRGGQCRVMFVPKSDLDEIKKSSKFSSLWNKWPMEMVKKSTIRRHLKIEAIQDVQLALEKEEEQANQAMSSADTDEPQGSIWDKHDNSGQHAKIKEAEQVDSQADAPEQQQSEQAETVADKPVEESWLSKQYKYIDDHADRDVAFWEKMLERCEALPANPDRFSEDDRQKVIDKLRAEIIIAHEREDKKAKKNEKEGMF